MFDEDESGWKRREEALSHWAYRASAKVIGLGEEGQQPDLLAEEEIKQYIFDI